MSRNLTKVREGWGTRSLELREFSKKRKGGPPAVLFGPDKHRKAEAALSLFRLAEFCDDGEVFEGGGVAFDFAVGG